ncbi:MAG: sigma 54-interacting transcriptional regulator, partial [Calditrichaeota bacterium]|nr:sigma 54-interacting transcriptional regulator [Calditrichota bacterium]
MILVVAGILLPLAALPLFNYANLILPVFYPLLAYLATLFYLAAAERRREDLAGISHQQQLEAQIRHKASALDEARAQLEQLQTQLQTQTADAEEYRRQSASAEDAVRQLENELRDLQEYIVPEKAAAPAEMAGIIHAPEGRMSEVLELVSRIRGSDIPVLIVGETGTGKEMIARAIHDTGGRKGRPFIAINCGALPENLLESELFGHEKGAFTGAQARRRGRFELADGGTIFLDEITETTPAFQARLLRVLQEGSFERVGGEETIEVDVRVIAACNRDLQQEIGSGAFRSDLYYRLNGFPIPLPPLRERPEDIPLLADYFLKKHAAGRVDAISDQVMEMLRIYRWPGNVRELENAVRRAALLAQGEQRSILRLSDLPPEIRPGNPEGVSEAVYQPLETQILALLRGFKFSRSSITQTAQALGNRDRGTVTEYFRGI